MGGAVVSNMIRELMGAGRERVRERDEAHKGSGDLSAGLGVGSNCLFAVGGSFGGCGGSRAGVTQGKA